MLNCYSLDSPDQKISCLQDLSTNGSVFVVSDLAAKLWLQSLLREQKGGVLASDCVLRASELWLKLLHQVEPRWEVLPRYLTPYVFEKKMSEILMSEDIPISIQDSRRLFQTMGQILPLLSHHEGEGLLASWFAERADAYERWGHWARMSQLLWQDLKSNFLLPQEWMKAVLLNQSVNLQGQERFIFDLDLDLDDVEAELITNLSRYIDVHLLVPRSQKDEAAFATLTERAQWHDIKAEKTVIKNERTIYKFPSPLAEVKQATAQVRKWLDEGTLAKDIAIYCPDVETYWPSLFETLRVEGVPADKPVLAPLSQRPDLQAWLSRLRMSLERMNSEDGEQVVFFKDQVPEISHQDYLKLYSHIYDQKDFQRGNAFPQELFLGPSEDVPITFSDFSQWCLKQTPTGNQASVYELFDGLDEVLSLRLTLLPRQWLSFLETWLARKEIKICSAQKQGVSVLNLSQSTGRPFKKIFIMGLHEQALVDDLSTALLLRDVESIRFQFGFNLNHADQSLPSKRLAWLLEKQAETQCLSYAETDFTGRFQAPSLFWLRQAVALGHPLSFDSPEACRWDEVGANKLKSGDESIVQSLTRDLGQSERDEKIKISNLSLSASKFEEFHKCPFRLFASVGLGLGLQKPLDLDLDPMTRGQLLHKACERIVENSLFDLKSEALSELLDKCREDLEQEVYSEELWSFVKFQLIKILESFVSFEKTWRQKYPQTKTWSLEKKIKGYVCLSQEGVFFSQDQGEWNFRGTIDRIDSNGRGEYFLIDYKSGSSQSIKAYKSWLSTGQLQLLIYTLALEDQILPLDGKIMGATYYSLKDMNREKSFINADADPEFLSGKVKGDQFQELLRQTRGELAKVVTSIGEGVYLPDPREDDLCKTCDWNQLCRYPNLN